MYSFWINEARAESLDSVSLLTLFQNLLKPFIIGTSCLLFPFCSCALRPAFSTIRSIRFLIEDMLALFRILPSSLKTGSEGLGSLLIWRIHSFRHSCNASYASGVIKAPYSSLDPL